MSAEMSCGYTFSDVSCGYQFSDMTCGYVFSDNTCGYEFGDISKYLLTEDFAILFAEDGTPLEVE